MGAARLQVSVEDRDFQDINVVGVDDQRSMSWDLLQLRIIDAADQAGDDLEGANDKTLRKCHVSTC